MKHDFVAMNYIITVAKTQKSKKQIYKEDAFYLTPKTALLAYRCADCDTVIATTTTHEGVFNATASQIAGESQELRCSKCEAKY